MRRIWSSEEEFFDHIRSLSIEDRLKLRVGDFYWSTRAHNALQSAGINTLEQLCGYTESKLLRIRNLGRKSLHEVKLMLALVGLHLGGVHSIVVVPPGIRTMNDWAQYELRLKNGKKAARTRKEKSLAHSRKIVAEHARMKSALEGLRDYLTLVSPRLNQDHAEPLLQMVDVGLEAA